MKWTVQYEPSAVRQLRKLDKYTADRITSTLEKRVASQEDPKVLAKAMTGPWEGLWRFRIGDYRAICQIDDGKLVVLIVKIGHRKNIYD